MAGNDLHQDEVTTWYFSIKELEYNSPSRRDGIDLKTETFLRKSYCTLLKDLGDRLTVPQITIATAIVFCHRFFIHQSHAKNDRWMIAKVCMLLAGKVEETPRDLKDIIIFSNEIIHKKDLDADQSKEVYEQQKELVLKGELLVLSTLKFDLNVRHPYKPLAEATEKYKVEETQFPKVAQSLVNGCLRTSLCLQYKPHHIAAYAFSQAAKYLETKLQAPQEVLLKEFDVTLSQLEDIRDQMLGLDVWYFSREEIENNSPSKLDGIDIKTEAQLRKKYCTFLIDLGARLKVHQILVSTAIVLCHRFFSRQSHAKNDCLTIATVCMLLATKVEDCERDIEDVIVSSYEIIHKVKETLDDVQREEVYEQQNELVLSGEYLVLSTLNFDLNVRHPYLPLAKAIWKYKVKEANAHFPIVARSFVDECLKTTLSLQYQPHHIAGFVFFLAASRLKMKPQLGAYANALLQEFDITRSQLKDMSDQMRELSKNDSNESGTQNPVQDRSSPERTGMAS